MALPSAVRAPGRGLRRVLLLLSSCLLVGTPGAFSQSTEAPSSEEDRTLGLVVGELPPLKVPGVPYRTPLAGQGFQADVFGREVHFRPDDRRIFNGWSVGLAWTADISELEYLPYGALYLWRRPDANNFFRAMVVGFFNEVFYSHSPASWGPWEWVVKFDSYTPPIDYAEYVDGQRDEQAELVWGEVNLGLGGGFRTSKAPYEADNMLATTFTFEPGYFYAEAGADTGPTYVVPSDTFVGRLRLQVKKDAMLRNILELPHRGHAWGMDAIYGFRTNWDDWGFNGSQAAADTRDYGILKGYAMSAGGVPGVESDRHRLLGTFWAGISDGTDRFSATRLGGGPQGDEYESVSNPTVPGTLFQEFFPENYAVGIAEYRFEPAFYSYVGLVGSLSWLDRDRVVTNNVVRDEDVLASIGLRWTTGFLWSTRLQVEYHYNTGAIRSGDYGGHTAMIQIAGRF